MDDRKHEVETDIDLKTDLSAFISRDLKPIFRDMKSSPPQLLGQIQIWRSLAEKNNTLVQAEMNDEISGQIVTDELVFYTNGLHGCVVFLELKDGNYKFGHIQPVLATTRIDEWKKLGENSNGILLMPNIPEFNGISGDNVIKYNLEMNFTPDSFAEGMALHESPEIQSACIYIKADEEGHYSGYINAFERTINAKWYVPYLPTHVAKRIEIA